eukprot:2585941-Rhodomonas_salina.2
MRGRRWLSAANRRVERAHVWCGSGCTPGRVTPTKYSPAAHSRTVTRPSCSEGHTLVRGDLSQSVASNSSIISSSRPTPHSAPTFTVRSPCHDTSAAGLRACHGLLAMVCRDVAFRLRLLACIIAASLSVCSLRARRAV